MKKKQTRGFLMKEWRENTPFSQTEWARLLNAGIATVKAWESGNSNPSDKFFQRLAYLVETPAEIITKGPKVLSNEDEDYFYLIKHRLEMIYNSTIIPYNINIKETQTPQKSDVLNKSNENSVDLSRAIPIYAFSFIKSTLERSFKLGITFSESDYKNPQKYIHVYLDKDIYHQKGLYFGSILVVELCNHNDFSVGDIVLGWSYAKDEESAGIINDGAFLSEWTIPSRNCGADVTTLSEEYVLYGRVVKKIMQ